MKFLADRIQQVQGRSGKCNGTAGREHPGNNGHVVESPIRTEMDILRAANAVVEAEAEWLLQKLKSDLTFVLRESGNGSVEEARRCATRVATFMKSSRDFESSEFSSILECADRIFSELDFEPSRKYSQAFRSLKCRILDELRQIYARQNLEFSL